MPTCSVCQVLVPNSRFSTAQLKKSPSSRKCLGCVPTTVVPTIMFDPSPIMRWMKGEDARMTGFRMEQNNGCRQITTTRRLRSDEDILSVPYTLMMTQTAARQSISGKLLTKYKEVSFSSHTYLAMYLLEEREKGVDSTFHVYISSLPKTYDDMPLFFGKRMKKRLQGSLTVPMLSMRQCSMKNEYAEVITAVRAVSPEQVHEFERRFSFRDYQWARTAVITRVFSCDSRLDGDKTDGHEECLVPVADMMNHSRIPSIGWGFDRSRDAFVMKTLHPIMSGRQLCDSYGAKCNSRYFINYGFTMPDNAGFDQASLFFSRPLFHDEFSMFMGPPSNYDDGYSGYSSFMKLGEETRIQKDDNFRFQISAMGPDPVTSSGPTYRLTVSKVLEAMFSFCRMAVADPKERVLLLAYCSRKMTSIMKSPDETVKAQMVQTPLVVFSIPFVSEENERRTIDLIARACQRRQSDFPSVLEHDLKLRDTCRPFTTDCNVANMLISEKQVFQYYLNLAEFVRSIPSGKLVRTLRKREEYKTYHRMCQNPIST